MLFNSSSQSPVIYSVDDPPEWACWLEIPSAEQQSSSFTTASEPDFSFSATGMSAMYFVPNLSLKALERFASYENDYIVSGFLDNIMDNMSSHRICEERLADYYRIVRRLILHALDDPDFYQCMVDELESRPRGCSDDNHVHLVDLDRLSRRGRIRSVDDAALTALREVCLKYAMHRACIESDQESVTVYGMLAHAFDVVLYARYGGSEPKFQPPHCRDFCCLSDDEIEKEVNAFLDQEIVSGYARTRADVADWSQWMTYASKLNEIAAEITSIENACETTRAEAGDNEAQQYVAVIEKDEKIIDIKTAILACALEQRRNF